MQLFALTIFDSHGQLWDQVAIFSDGDLAEISMVYDRMVYDNQAKYNSNA